MCTGFQSRVRQAAVGDRQTEVARAQGLSPALLGRWPRQAVAEAVPSRAERDEMKRLRAALERVEQAHDRLKRRDRLRATAFVRSRYQFIGQVAPTGPVWVRCCVLRLGPAGCYQWLRRAGRPTPAREPAATAASSRHAQRYGTRRWRAALPLPGPRRR